MSMCDASMYVTQVKVLFLLSLDRVSPLDDSRPSVDWDRGGGKKERTRDSRHYFSFPQHFLFHPTACVILEKREGRFYIAFPFPLPLLVS